MIKKTVTVLGRLNAPTVRISAAGSAACLALMTAIILLQVFCRYVLNSPLAWPEEIARFLMVWMAFLAAPYAYREGLFVRLETWIGRFNERIQRVVNLGIQALLVILFLLLFKESLWLVERGSVIRASSVNLSLSWVFAVLPAMFLLLISTALEMLLKLFLNENPTGAAS